jgi:delta 1-pyrroline-5-carboxylate dehydrogenase
MMTVRYTSAANVLPESKMRLYPTKVINIIGGPGSDKSLISSAIILYLHLHNKTVETIPDYAKSLVWQQKREGALANLIAPHAFEIKNIADVKAEIFGPVLQVVRWGSGALSEPANVIAQINALGYGLTLGIQTRIDSRAQALAAAAHVGNVYINRNKIGAVVGVQPFGGEGLSGTGPKAGGPHYLYRFCAEQTVTVNTTAAGGNAQLLASAH